MSHERPLILEIFPGISLFGRAFEEVWPEACIVRAPDLLWGGDIHRFHPPSGKFDGVIGGPPCQAFSPLARLVRATGKEPRHGNLIPEFERCVEESAPAWFVMENVSDAPKPVVAGYAVAHFMLCPTWLGAAQRRRRRFSFGVIGETAVDLRRFIEYAALEVPDVELAVTGDSRAVSVKIGGSGKYKQLAVRGKNGYRRTWAQRCELQGVPSDFLVDAPFTTDGKQEALGNGVHLPMGLAIAAAVRRAVDGRADAAAIH